VGGGKCGVKGLNNEIKRIRKEKKRKRSVIESKEEDM